MSTERGPGSRDRGFHTLEGGDGISVVLCDVGASLVSLQVPDRDGRPGEVVLGLDLPRDYLDNPNYLGATVGRCAGRIRHGRFRLQGRDHQLPLNFGEHHLHGGPRGFSHGVWDATRRGRGEDGAEEITFTLHSPDGDQGYPGAVDVAATYRLESGGRLRIRFRGRTDAPTHLSLTNHAYFNLRSRGAVDGHRLRMDAVGWVVTHEAGIPTGEVAPVAGTAMDFTRGKPLFADAGHYDHCFALEGWDDAERWAPGAERPASGADDRASRQARLRKCARVEEPESGRVMTVSTTFPGLQLYTPDFGPGTAGRGGGYRGREAFCLEAQFFPDAPNQPAFPSTRLEPGEVWEHETVLDFSVR